MGDFNVKVARREPSAMSSAVELYGLSPIHTSNNVEATFDFVAQNGNIVEATGNKIACCFDIVASVNRALGETNEAGEQL